MCLGGYGAGHRACGAGGISAVYPDSRKPWDFPELVAEGPMPHKVKELYIVGAPNLNHWVDISDTMDVKIAALMAHASQFVGRTDEIAQRVREQRATIGQKYRVTYADEFHLPLNPQKFFNFYP